MKGKTSFFYELAEIAFARLDRNLETLEEEEIDWKPANEANSIRWTLTHISYICNVYIPRAFQKNYEYEQAGRTTMGKLL